MRCDSDPQRGLIPSVKVSPGAVEPGLLRSEKLLVSSVRGGTARVKPPLDSDSPQRVRPMEETTVVANPASSTTAKSQTAHLAGSRCVRSRQHARGVKPDAGHLTRAQSARSLRQLETATSNADGHPPTGRLHQGHDAPSPAPHNAMQAPPPPMGTKYRSEMSRSQDQGEIVEPG